MKKREKKAMITFIFLFLSLLVTNAQTWYKDFDEAKAAAQQGDKRIILVFKGSDWNGACIRLKNEMWSNSEFQQYAKEHYIMLEADFPKRKENKLSVEQLEKNNKLIETYNRSKVIPLVVVLDKDGNLLGTTGYKDVDVEKYIELLNFFK